MAAKMAVYNEKYKKIFPETGKILFDWFLNYKHYPCNIPVMVFIHHSEFDIFKMASRMVPDKFYNSVGAAYLYACLMDL